VQNENFTATVIPPSTYSISGTISLSGGGNLQGVTVTLTSGGNTVGSATTGSNGQYSIAGVANGSYSLTPALAGYTFNPTTLSPTVSGTNVQNENFTATANTYSISGTITLGGGGNLQGVTVTLTSGGNTVGSATTGSNGQYSIAGVANGVYTLTPTLAGYTFNPSTLSPIVIGTNVQNENFTATTFTPPYSISGTITLNGNGLSGVTVNYGGNNSVTTNGSGAYTISGVANGSYTLTPSLAGYTFNPTSQTITVSGGNAAQNFTATAIPSSTYSISGTITLSGAGLAGVTVACSAGSATTNGSGAYTITGAASGSYTLTPALAGYTFTPTTLPAAVNGANLTGENFTATINPPASVAAPAFSPALGAYNSTQTVTISCATSGATIYYTTDGTTPTAASTKYTAPISISASTQLQAIAIETGLTSSPVISGVYNIAGSSTYVPDTDNDTDGNGYPDEVKTALGVSLTNSSATPLNMQAGITPQALTLKKLSVKLNFAKVTGNDEIMLSGSLPITAGLVASSQTVVVDVGGVVKVFTLNSKGKGVAATGYPAATSAKNDHFSLKFKSVKGKASRQTGTFTAQFNKGTFASSFADVGLLGSASVKKVTRTVPVIILFNNQMYQAAQAVQYTATASKAGLAAYTGK
jgi:inhibitor of cysteine peptidase